MICYILMMSCGEMKIGVCVFRHCYGFSFFLWSSRTKENLICRKDYEKELTAVKFGSKSVGVETLYEMGERESNDSSNLYDKRFA